VAGRAQAKRVVGTMCQRMEPRHSGPGAAPPGKEALGEEWDGTRRVVLAAGSEPPSAHAAGECAGCGALASWHPATRLAAVVRYASVQIFCSLVRLFVGLL
jgi:hypothetical protein